MLTNSVEDADMGDCDGERVVTMMDVLQEQQDFEDDANAVLGASDDKNCTYAKGYIKRQAIYACMTCCSEAKEDPTKRAGVCLACSLNCHENHELIELYTKRNFRCDCGNPKFNSHPCQYTPNKNDMNIDNKYNQNFAGLYCNCHRPYPDPEATEEDEMIQCIICEDWLHAAHLDAVVPGSEQYSEMICKACMDKNDFLYDYSSIAVNVETEDVDVTTVNGISSIMLPNGKSGSEEPDKVEMEPTEPEKTTSMDIDGTETENESEILNNTNSDVPCSYDTASQNVPKETNEKTEIKLQETSNVNSCKDDINSATVENNAKLEGTDDILKNKDSTNVSSKDKIEDSKAEVTAHDLAKESLEKKNDVQEENVVNSPEAKDIIENKLTDETEASKIEKTEQEELNQQEDTTRNIEIKNICAADNSNEDKEEIKMKENLPAVEIKPTEAVTNTKSEDLTTNNSTSVTTSKPLVDEVIEYNSESNISETIFSELVCENITDDIKEEASTENDNKPSVTPTDSETNSSLMDTTVEEPITDKEVPSPKKVDQEINGIANDEGFDEVEDAVTSPLEEKSEFLNELATEHKDTKRKLSTEEAIDDSLVKKPKLDESQCMRPKNTKRSHRGAIFWPSTFRQKLCTCGECISMYKDLNLLFLIDPEDTVSAYEALGKEKVNSRATQYEKGLEALSSLDRIQQINALTEYNKMRDKLLDYLKSFKDRKEVVKEEDIKAFFAGMKPKREPDGVYFCR